jgi:hypothetical protein
MRLYLFIPIPSPALLPYPFPRPHSHSALPLSSADTIIYAASGHGSIITNPSLLAASSSSPDPLSDFSHLTRYDLAPGDFAIIPAWTEHQEVNDSDEDVVWVITCSGGSPVVVNLEGWGKGRKKG